MKNMLRHGHEKLVRPYILIKKTVTTINTKTCPKIHVTKTT
jgi:hypothetical protein